MLGFFWLFWVVPLLFLAAGARRRRWRRWEMMGPGGYGPYARYGPYGAPWERGGRWAGSLAPGDAPSIRREVEEQRAYVDALESRIVQLEERLDFTERLLAARHESRPNPRPEA